MIHLKQGVIKLEKWLEKRISFIKGLFFVSCAYIIIKMVDNYQVFFASFKDILATLSPFLLAFIIAYIFNPVMMFIEKRFKVKRNLSLSLTYFGFLLLCYLMISFIFPVIYHSASDLIKQIPSYATEIQTWINGWTNQMSGFDFGELNEFKTQLLSMIPKVTEILTSSIGSLVSITYGAVTLTGNVLLAFIISIYILVEKEKFTEMSKKLIYIIFRPKNAGYILQTSRLFHENIGKYLIGKSIDSIFVGICATIGLALMGAKYAVLLGVIFGLTNMVPFVGPIFGTLIAVGINLFYNPIVAIIALIFLLIVQQVESLIIDPKVVGQKMGLNPFFTLLAVTVGGKLMGIVGMILGVPIMGVLKLYASNAINYYYDKTILVCEQEESDE